ncbi:Platelet-activating factor acetylhydrolase, plasma/intracellular isoform II superfamily [marine gamma proteobacterium HTCC2148]|nr:Platelet-activating factor acetylhydrolase, plasma/intracellular isoform II superfamily [marine gamma proteobacterium HTCC2148]
MQSTGEPMKQKLMTGKLCLALVLMSFLATGVNAGTKNGSPFYFPSEPGPYSVGYETYAISDNERDGRTLLLDVWYPVRRVDTKDAADAAYFFVPEAFGVDPLPARFAKVDVPIAPRNVKNLVVFSHGNNSFSAQSIALTETLASHGYVVVAPNHTGNTVFDPTDPFEVAALNRVGDVGFVIDHIMARNADEQDSFFQQINPDNVGVTGHSFGGFTTVGAAVGYEGIEGDPRISAIAPVSGVIQNIFTPEQLATIDIPVLLLGGTDDQVVPIEGNDYAYQNLVGEKPVHQVNLIGANHEQFAVLCDLGDSLINSGVAFEDWSTDFLGSLLLPRYTRVCLEALLEYETVERLQNQYVVSFFRRYLPISGSFWKSEPYGIFLFPDWKRQDKPDSKAWRKSGRDPSDLWY